MADDRALASLLGPEYAETPADDRQLRRSAR
jgi:hypothetical protein